MRARPILLTLMPFSIALLFLNATGMACPVYVAPDGEDTGRGGPAAPYATLQYAVNVSTPGDTIFLYDGRFAGPGNREVELKDRALWFASVSGDPSACVVDCGGLDGLLFDDNCAEFCFPPYDEFSPVDTLGVESIRFTNANVAIKMIHGQVQTSNNRYCVLRSVVVDSSVVGLKARNHVLAWDDIAVSDSDTGVYLFDCNGLVDGLRIRGSGRGLWTDDLPCGDGEVLTLRNAELVGNDYGVDAFTEFQRVIFEDCRVDSNATAGMFVWSSEVGRAILRRTTVNHNQGPGVWLRAWASLETDETEICGNGAAGVRLEMPEYATVHLDRTLIADNGGWGIETTPFPGGILFLEVRDSRLLGNLMGGCRASVYSATFARSLAAGNGGVGIQLAPGYLPRPRERSLSSCTIASNDGDGVVMSVSCTNFSEVLVAGNAGIGVSLSDTNGIVFARNDIHANGGGDWVGSIAPRLGSDGNIWADPCFCDPVQGNYDLCAESPCLPTGTRPEIIGAFGKGCGTPSDVERPGRTPAAYRLAGAHPNPFNPMTTITYDLSAAAMVTLRIYDPRGRLVQVLADRRPREPGRHEAVWRGRDLQGRSAAAGVYLVRLQAGGFSATQRLTLIR